MTEMKKILLLTGSGFIGRHLYSRLGPEGAMVTYHSRPIEGGIWFDVLTMNLGEVLTKPEPISHAVILLGDTKPESCAADLERSQAINVQGIQRILLQLKERGVKPVFTSTEVVFDGTKGDYTETDQVRPILTYGRQKVEVEKFMQASLHGYLIVRLGMVYGSELGDRTILTKWAEAINANRQISCAHDYVSSPIYVGDVVTSILALIEHDCHGIYHLAGRRAYSRCDLFDLLLAHAKDYGLKVPQVRRCSINDFDVTESRPLNVSMQPNKLIRDTSVILRDVEAVCREIAQKAFDPA